MKGVMDMTDKFLELYLLEVQVQTKISELRSKGYSNDEIIMRLEQDETYKKFNELSDQIFDELL